MADERENGPAKGQRCGYHESDDCEPSCFAHFLSASSSRRRSLICLRFSRISCQIDAIASLLACTWLSIFDQLQALPPMAPTNVIRTLIEIVIVIARPSNGLP